MVEAFIAGAVIVAAGTQGNLRHIGVTHDEPSEFVCYSLADPRIINDKHVIVIGAGRLSHRKCAWRCKSATTSILSIGVQSSVEQNRAISNAVLGSINDARSTLDCYYDSSVKSNFSARTIRGDGGR